MIAPLGKGVMPMNKKELLAFGLITSLLVNVTIGTRYVVDTKELQDKSDILNQKYTDVTKENEQLKKDLAKRKEVKNKRQLNMELTFYVADCRGCSGITKSGIEVTNTIYYKNMRIIATDPQVIPLHSIVKVETENESYIAYAADTGGAIKG